MRWIHLSLVAFTLVAACRGPQLMPTPNLYVASETDPFVEVPQALRTTEVDVLYATDRMPEYAKDGTLTYTDDRSDSLAFGSRRVQIGSEDAT